MFFCQSEWFVVLVSYDFYRLKTAGFVLIDFSFFEFFLAY